MVNFVLVNSQAQALTPRDETLKRTFQKPLIVGASVSADFNTPSPGKRVALQYTEAKNIKVVAQNGKSAQVMIAQINDDLFKDRTVIVGLDLFFWDSFQASPQASLDAMKSLFEKAKRNHVELILGEIPELMPSFQKSVVRINEKMRDLCRGYASCKIIPLHKISMQVLAQGFAMHRGKKYPLEVLLPDGFHISAPASEYLADEILKLYE